MKRKNILVLTTVITILFSSFPMLIFAEEEQLDNKTSQQEYVIENEENSIKDLERKNELRSSTIEHGDLYFDGGQTEDIVYSEIGQTYQGKKLGHDYNVMAIVHVGRNKYSSGWKKNFARITKERSFWANETASYDYERLFQKKGHL